MYEKKKDEKIIALQSSYCNQRRSHNEGHHAPIFCCYQQNHDGGHHKYYFLHTLNSKIKLLNNIQLL